MHKCFISYHHDDQQYVNQFVRTFDILNNCFIHRAVGVMDDNIINSTDTDYIMRRIRELYLADSTVTIILIGGCTWSRKYVDWEIASTLRNDPNNKRSGLIGIFLPYVSSRMLVPPRLQDNINSGYAQVFDYPKYAWQLTNWIEAAFNARFDSKKSVDNTRDLFGKNKQC